MVNKLSTSDASLRNLFILISFYVSGQVYFSEKFNLNNLQYNAEWSTEGNIADHIRIAGLCRFFLIAIGCSLDPDSGREEESSC